MGVLNVTPDSFYDGGRYLAPEHARAQVERMLREGADIIDVGAESSRPGSVHVSADEQLARLETALCYAVERGAAVSIDTTSAEVAARVVGLGTQTIHYVSCLANQELARVTAAAGATLVLMHARGPMSAQRGFSVYPDAGYGDVVSDVLDEWRSARDRAVAAGMSSADVWLDPGLGFAKNARQSFELLARLPELTREGVPVVVGASRKSFIASVDGAAPGERIGGTIAACLAAVERGARVLRVHDVLAVRQALAVARLAESPHARVEAPYA